MIIMCSCTIVSVRALSLPLSRTHGGKFTDAYPMWQALHIVNGELIINNYTVELLLGCTSCGTVVSCR